MKLALSLSLSFLLFAFITKLPVAFSNDVEPRVLDTKGNPLVSGVEYSIVPSVWGPTGGGLKLEATGDLECPVTVLQYNVLFEGIPVIFNRINETSIGTISLGIPLYINFPESDKLDCAESSRWLVFFDDDIEKACVGIGGPENYPDMKIVSGFFNIQKTSVMGYKLQFRVTETDSPTSLDIGRYDHSEGGSRLVLTEHAAFDVVFKPESSYDINNNDGIIKSVA